MDPYIDNFKLMELEFQFHDDNTSCSSSLSTSLSEDIDDLRLGAEAVSFSSKLDDCEINGKRKTEQKIFVMKENHDLINTEDLNRTFSTIKSISDLIEARECDPVEILFGLGFAPLDNDESRKSILSRFHSSSPPRENKQDTELSHSEVQRPDKKRIGNDMHASITKTKEWLAKQGSVEDDLPSLHREENQDKEKIQKCTLEIQSQLSQSSKRAQQRKQPGRRRLKSRQSSFELLLPNVTEEDSIPDGEEDDSNIQSAKQLIRESSQEAVESQAYYQSVPSPKDLKSKLHKLEKQENISFSDYELYSKEISAFHSSSSNSPDTETETVKVRDRYVDEDNSDAIRQLSPYKHHQTLAMAQVDSFELEEVVSNDSHPSPDSTMNRVAAGRKVEIGLENKPKPPPARRHGVVVAPFIANELHVPSSSSSDSSSGFEEGTMEEPVENSHKISDAVLRLKEEKRNVDLRCRYEVSQLVAQYCDNLACTITLHAITSDLRTPWQREFEAFCSSRSKIACAGGVAEAALRLRALKKTIEKESTSIESQKNEKKSSIFTSRLAVSTAKNRSSYPPGSLSNFNNNNISIHSGLKVRGHLQRYASSPAIVQSSVSSPKLLQDRTRFSSDLDHSFDSDSSLLSSISAITNLSCRSSEFFYRSLDHRSGNTGFCPPKTLDKNSEYIRDDIKSIYNGIPSSEEEPSQQVNPSDIRTDKMQQNTAITMDSDSLKPDTVLSTNGLSHADNNRNNSSVSEQRCSSKACNCSNSLLQNDTNRQALMNSNKIRPVKLKDRVEFSASEVIGNFCVSGDCQTHSLVNGT